MTSTYSVCTAVTSTHLTMYVHVDREVKAWAASILPATTAAGEAFSMQSTVEKETWQRAQMSECLNARRIREHVLRVSPALPSSEANRLIRSHPWRTAVPFFPPSPPHTSQGQMWPWICLRWLGYPQQLKKAWSAGLVCISAAHNEYSFPG